MKVLFTKLKLFVLLSSLTIGAGFSQNSPMKRTLNDNCGQQPRGLFSQVTGASMNLSAEFYAPRLMQHSNLRDDHWTLSPLDEVDPAYKFLLLAKDAKGADTKCGDATAITGKLISPMGKVFVFKHAVYDFPSRKLKFTTFEKDGLIYEVDIQFYPKALLIKGIYHEGIVILRASGKALGTVTLEFPFTSAGFE